MSTPATPSNLPSSGPVPAPAPATSPSDAQINALAAQLAAMTANGPSASLSQATVVALALTGTPPTCSIMLSGSTTQIGGVRFLSGYTPVVSDTVSVLKQDGSILIIGHTADLGTATATTAGWATTSITGIQYRKVMDNGAWKVQFTGSGTATGTSLFTLPAGFQPSATCNIPVLLSNNPVAWMQITTGGVCTLVAPFGGGTTGSAGDHVHGIYESLDGHLSNAGTDLGHSHINTDVMGPGGLTDDGPGPHTHTIPGGTLTFSNTLWLDSKEFFL